MKKNSKKLIIAAMSLSMFTSNLLMINAKDSLTQSMQGYTIYGSITDTSVSGSVTGASGASATVDAYFYIKDGKSIKAKTVSGSPYVSLYISSAVAADGKRYDTWKFNRARIIAKLPNSAAVTTRFMIN